MQILVIEDEIRLAKNIKKGLENEGYTVDISYDGKDGINKIILNSYDLIVLDLMLPEKSGIEVLKDIRINDKKNKIPIIILTAKNTIEDKIYGLNKGADDYLSKPFDFNELVARIRSLIRRSTNNTTIELKVGNLILNQKTKEVSRANKKIKLSSTEYRLLEFMMLYKNHILSESEIIDHVWKNEYDGMSNLVSVYIGYLRKKIDKDFENDNMLIYNIRGLGYKITDQINN